jgi:hypothetical protein
MKKTIQCIICLIAIAMASFNLHAQEKSNNKVKTVTERAAEKANKAAQNSQEVSNNVQNAGQQVQATVANVKSIIAVFEPIFRLRRKKTAPMAEPVPTQQNTENTVETPTTSTTQTAETLPTEAPSVFEPESSAYNADGSANWGSQNHQEFGSYLDIMRGQILDDISVATETQSVDLIFTATDHFGNATAYGLLTPSYVKNDIFANYYFRGTKYKDTNIPPRTWQQVNESEIALTALTGEQFARIQNNQQLEAVVKQVQGFRNHFESRTKLTGKVFAVKTEMANRTCYGLIHVVNHYGTSGANGYLQVKIKVTGLDANNDGSPDANLYINR